MKPGKIQQAIASVMGAVMPDRAGPELVLDQKFSGLLPKGSKQLKNAIHTGRANFFRALPIKPTSKYKPHQGAKEKGRRIMQMARGMDCGQFNGDPTDV